MWNVPFALSDQVFPAVQHAFRWNILSQNVLQLNSSLWKISRISLLYWIDSFLQDSVKNCQRSTEYLKTFPGSRFHLCFVWSSARNISLWICFYHCMFRPWASSMDSDRKLFFHCFRLETSSPQSWHFCGWYWSRQRFWLLNSKFDKCISIEDRAGS